LPAIYRQRAGDFKEKSGGRVRERQGFSAI
jgi:hypothetical protein